MRASMMQGRGAWLMQTEGKTETLSEWAKGHVTGQSTTQTSQPPAVYVLPRERSSIITDTTARPKIDFL